MVGDNPFIYHHDMTDPRHELAQLVDGGVEVSGLTEKHHTLLNHYATELSGVLRYIFDGQIVPSQIQEVTVFLRRYMHTLESGQTFQPTPQKTITLHEKFVDPNTQSYTFVFSGPDLIKHTLQLTLLEDTTWGVHPITQITYNNKNFRSVALNGDVRNHLTHQHTWYEPGYLTPIKDAGLITEKDVQLINVFHQVHDLPEIEKGDKHVNDKSLSDSEEEAVIISKLMHDVGIYTEEEKRTLALLFQLYEHKTNYFKGGERLMYINDAIDSHFHQVNYFNEKTYLVKSILGNQLKLFATEEAKVDITCLSGTTTTLPLQKLPSAPLFFNQQKERIDKILACHEYNDIVPTREKIVNAYKL